MSTADIYNFRRVNERLITGGQPAAEQLQNAAAEGFQAVINLATYHPGSSLEDEASLVQSLGMTYHAIPVEWEAPQARDFSAFEDVLQQLGDQKVLIHCAANFRVSAFYSLYAEKHLGWSPAQAEEFRASIWAGSDYPIWEKFIREMQSDSD